MVNSFLASDRCISWRFPSWVGSSVVIPRDFKIEYCFGQVTLVTDDLSMGLTSVPTQARVISSLAVY